MADSGAVRQARYKRHQAGDHSTCKHDRPLRLAPAPPPDPDFDAAAELRALAARLSAAYAADTGNAALARELRVTLQALAPDAGAVDPELAEMFKAFRDA